MLKYVNSQIDMPHRYMRRTSCMCRVSPIRAVGGYINQSHIRFKADTHLPKVLVVPIDIDPVLKAHSEKVSNVCDDAPYGLHKSQGVTCTIGRKKLSEGVIRSEATQRSGGIPRRCSCNL